MTTTDQLEGLEIKAYFAGSVQEAMNQATRELGPEALLLNSRQAPPEARHLGEFEVVFAASPAVRLPLAKAQPARAASQDGPPDWELLCRELRDLRVQVRHMGEALSGRYDGQAPQAFSDALETLLQADVRPDVAQEVVERVQARIGTSLLPEVGRSARGTGRNAPGCDAEVARRHLIAELEGRISVDTGLATEGDTVRTIALVGPPGAGKTTTLVKLAVAYGLRARRSVHLLSVDSCRIGAAEQLRAYAAILGVGFQSLETTRALDQAIFEHRTKSLILVDTPGLSASSLEDGGDLGKWLREHADVDTHLVLPASMRRADLERMVEAFSIFQPGKLLFTRLDETEAWGQIFSLAACTRKPISFLAFGQLIPEDLEPATACRIAAGILGGSAQRLWSAA